MQRRSFLTAAGAMALAPLTKALAQGSAIPAAKLARLSISSSSYRGNYEGRFNVPTATPKLSHRTFPAYVKEKFGVTKVELWDQQFGPAGTTFAECRAIRAAADAAGVQVVSVEVESTAPINAPDADDRAQDAVRERRVHDEPQPCEKPGHELRSRCPAPHGVDRAGRRGRDEPGQRAPSEHVRQWPGPGFHGARAG